MRKWPTHTNTATGPTWRYDEMEAQLGSSVVFGSYSEKALPGVPRKAPRCSQNMHISATPPHFWCLGDRKVLQEAWGLVPDGLRILLVEAGSELMELKYRGARPGGASDGMRTT